MVKSNYNIEKLEHMSDVLKAVSHPLRIAIVDLLINSKELTVTDIYSTLNILQPEASRQLKTLKIAGLIKCRKEANTRYYSITDKNLSKLLHCVENCTL